MTPIPRAERLIVALDVPTPQEARALVERVVTRRASTSSAWSFSWRAATSSCSNGW